MIYFGIDPGKSGAIVANLQQDRTLPNDFDLIKLSETEADIAAWLEDWSMFDCYATLEQVNAMPKQGVASTFKFGQSYGFLRGILTAHRIPFELVTPAKWQAAMQCRTKGDKNVTKARAQQLWPHERWTHATADAALLAEYGRRKREGM